MILDRVCANRRWSGLFGIRKQAIDVVTKRALWVWVAGECHVLVIALLVFLPAAFAHAVVEPSLIEPAMAIPRKEVLEFTNSALQSVERITQSSIKDILAENGSAEFRASSGSSGQAISPNSQTMSQPSGKCDAQDSGEFERVIQRLLIGVMIGLLGAHIAIRA